MVKKINKKTPELEIFQITERTGPAIPLMGSRVSAGFPEAVESFAEKTLDLHELLIRHAAATFFIRVKGNSMIGAGIFTGDILIVDRALSVSHNKIVIARIGDEFTVKRIKIEDDRTYFAPDNESYPDIEITDNMDAEIWGIVTYIIHKA